ncbi:MAG: 6-bladed beta-propeller [Prevotellaceae bacterium]|jgi:hypothetical protein|nr:6-bladed beta-propeller [Prevotellaceae bacterium]
MIRIEIRRPANAAKTTYTDNKLSKPFVRITKPQNSLAKRLIPVTTDRVMRRALGGLLCAYLCLSACTTKSASDSVHEGTTLSIDVGNVSDKRLQDITASIDTFYLETSDEHIIGSVDKVEKIGNKIYILDVYNAKSLFVYNGDTGRFMYNIGRYGNGPGEYRLPSDFAIHPISGNIFVLDDISNRLLQYDRSSGRFLSASSGLNNYIGDFIFTKDGNAIIYAYGNAHDGEYYLDVTDSEGQLIKELLPIPKHAKNMNIQPFAPLQSLPNDTIVFLPPFSNRIYQIYNDTIIQQRYFLDFGDHWPAPSYTENRDDVYTVSQELISYGYVIFVNYTETAELLHIYFTLMGKQYSYFYNKQTKQSVLIDNDLSHISEQVKGAFGSSFVYASYEEDGTALILFELDWEKI